MNRQRMAHAHSVTHSQEDEDRAIAAAIGASLGGAAVEAPAAAGDTMSWMGGGGGGGGDASGGGEGGGELAQHQFLDLAKQRDWARVRGALEANPGLVNACVSGRWSALHQAADADSIDASRMLLQYGADPLALNRDGQTPRELASLDELAGVLRAAELQASAEPAPERTWSPGAGQSAPRGGVAQRDEVICVGDVHGHLDKLTALWRELVAALGADAVAQARVVFLGDYCDRGPDTKGVIQWLLELQAAREARLALFCVLKQVLRSQPRSLCRAPTAAGTATLALPRHHCRSRCTSRSTHVTLSVSCRRPRHRRSCHPAGNKRFPP